MNSTSSGMRFFLLLEEFPPFSLFHPLQRYKRLMIFPPFSAFHPLLAELLFHA